MLHLLSLLSLLSRAEPSAIWAWVGAELEFLSSAGLEPSRVIPSRADSAWYAKPAANHQRIYLGVVIHEKPLNLPIDILFTKCSKILVNH